MPLAKRQKAPLGQRTLGQRTIGQRSPNVQLSESELRRAPGPGQTQMTSSQGTSGALGILSQNLATGIANRKKRGGAWQKKGQRNVSRQALGKGQDRFAQTADLMQRNMAQRQSPI